MICVKPRRGVFGILCAMSCPPSPDATAAGLRILLVDDHAIVREGLKGMLEAAAPGWTIEEAASGHDALATLRHSNVDVAVVDISMPGMSGLELLRRITAEFPRVRVLMLSMYAEEQYAVRAFRAGATGYLTKDSATLELIAAIRKSVSGGVYVSTQLAENLVLSLSRPQEDPRHAQLTDREIDVLRRLASGSSPADIAKALNISTKTVSTHKTRILDRLHLSNTAALIRYAIEHELVAGSIDPEH